MQLSTSFIIYMLDLQSCPFFRGLSHLEFGGEGGGELLV